jgi:hypothetical protein
MGEGPDREAAARRRRERLAAELRDNLKRRKAQQRGRAEQDPPAPKPSTSEGFSNGSH